jgi:hypothetical protein
MARYGALEIERQLSFVVPVIGPLWRLSRGEKDEELYDNNLLSIRSLVEELELQIERLAQGETLDSGLIGLAVCTVMHRRWNRPVLESPEDCATAMRKMCDTLECFEGRRDLYPGPRIRDGLLDLLLDAEKFMEDHPADEP